MNHQRLPRLYSELAAWWPLLSSPEEYTEEAEFYRQALVSAGDQSISTVLELGSGGGNNASHLKEHFDMTLLDLSPGMLAVSRQLNPECKHIVGDMRTVRVGRQFDAIFVHDAVAYMTSEGDLRAVMETAHQHCRPGGAALFAPDHTRETFAPSTKHGGHDQASRSLRYLEWTWDPDPSDTTYLSFMVYAMRVGGQEIRCVEDVHVCGLFAELDWLRMLAHSGFAPRAVPFTPSEERLGAAPIFLGVKPLRPKEDR